MLVRWRCVFFIAALSAWTPGLLVSQEPAPRRIEAACLPYALHRLTQADYERFLHAEEVRYVCFQQIMPGGPIQRLAIQRCAELGRAGKRNVLQIWWGPSRPYPWSKYSWANIALDAKVREDFWREVVDRCIDEFGAGNLYGVHLMEETGMQFGTDVQKRNDPNDFDTFEDDNRSYDHPFWSGWNKKWYGGVDIPNIRRHEDDFKRLVGFGFEDAAKWEPWQAHLFKRWVSNRIQSQGQVEFAKHVHQRYPGLKVFTWDGILWSVENPRADHHLERQYFDGVMTDCYGDVNENYYVQRAYRLLYPDAEIIHFAWGGAARKPADLDRRRLHTLGSYVAGVDVVGFYSEPMNYTKPGQWEEDMSIFRAMRQLPRFETKPPLLVISARVSDIYSLPYSVTGLTHYDILPMWEAYDVDLSRYDTLILDATSPPGDGEMLWDTDAFAKKHHFPGLLDYKRINDFVAQGGALIVRGRWTWPKDCPLFPVREGFLHSPDEQALVSDPNFEFTPDGWWAETIGRKGTYRFGMIGSKIAIDKPNEVQTCPVGTFFRFGKGACLLIPYHRNYDRNEPYGSGAWLSHRQLMSDLIRGFLVRVGKEQTARLCLADPALGNQYRRAPSASGGLDAWLLFHLDIVKRPRPIPLTGTDLLTGAVNPVLSSERSCALIRR